MSWLKTREGFLEYVRFKNYEVGNAKSMVSSLDRFVGDVEIRSPMDVMRVFSGLSTGQQRHLNRGMRAWFNFLELTGQASEDFLNWLRKAVPSARAGIDLNVPEEKQILADLVRLPKALPKYQAVYSMLLDSGLRLVEVVKVVNDFREVKEVNGFFRCPVGMFRKSKQAYYAYFTGRTFELVQGLSERALEAKAASRYFRGNRFTRPKYLRKFAFDMMVSLDIPESVADFIEGRVPQRIGAKHYMVLRRQADQKYKRYAEYITRLRQKALN